MVMRRNRGLAFLECFLFAGSSALLISVAHLSEDLWFVSLFALVPFLWRAIRVSLFESFVLGVLLGISYCFAAVDISIWKTPSVFLFNLLCLNVLLTLYAISVNRISKKIGFNAIFIALLWLPIEYYLNHYTRMGTIFTLQEAGGSTLSLRIASLFGVLMVSFLAVLINSIILVLSECMVQLPYSRTSLRVEFGCNRENRTIYSESILKRCFYGCSVNQRAPPFSQSIPV